MLGVGSSPRLVPDLIAHDWASLITQLILLTSTLLKTGDGLFGQFAGQRPLSGFNNSA